MQEAELSLLLSTGGQIGEKLILQVARQEQQGQQQGQQGSGSDEDVVAAEPAGQQGAAAAKLRLQVSLAGLARPAGLADRAALAGASVRQGHVEA